MTKSSLNPAQRRTVEIIEAICADLILKKEFENLFEQLSRLGNGFVDIEVRHRLPSRLVLERRYKELL